MSKIVEVNEKYGDVARTVFSVLVTPTLLLIVTFFLKQTYAEQKAVKAQQNIILVELGKIKTKEEHIEKEVEQYRTQLEKKIDSQKEIAQSNSSQVLELWKALKNN